MKHLINIGVSDTKAYVPSPDVAFSDCGNLTRSTCTKSNRCNLAMKNYMFLSNIPRYVSKQFILTKNRLLKHLPQEIPVKRNKSTSIVNFYVKLELTKYLR